MTAPTQNARELLRDLGIGNFNATMVIPFVWVAPATTDPKMSAVILIVKGLQAKLRALGFNVPGNGYLDNATAAALQKTCGQGWEQQPWADVIGQVLDAFDAAKEGATKIETPRDPKPNYGKGVMQLGSIPSLPDVPGGVLTYAAAAGLLYYFWTKRR